jgi:hypothetical protein
MNPEVDFNWRNWFNDLNFSKNSILLIINLSYFASKLWQMIVKNDWVLNCFSYQIKGSLNLKFELILVKEIFEAFESLLKLLQIIIKFWLMNSIFKLD